MRLRFAILLLCVALSAGCLGPGGGGPPPTPNATRTPAQLKYLLLDHYGESRFFFCDPDYYPVARGDELERAMETFPAIEKEGDVIAAITTRLRLQPPYSGAVKLAIYREFKKLRAIPLEPAGEGTYSFSLQLGDRVEGGRVSGIIRNDGTILSEQLEVVVLTCPICLSCDTMIDTPSGPMEVRDIGVGTVVWSPGRDGSREPVPVIRVGKSGVPVDHRVVHLRLSDGRELTASPGHPALDGRAVGSLAVGDRVDGVPVTGADTVIFGGEFTCDILPAGESGGYWANGIPLKSTLQAP